MTSAKRTSEKRRKRGSLSDTYSAVRRVRDWSAAEGGRRKPNEPSHSHERLKIYDTVSDLQGVLR